MRKIKTREVLIYLAYVIGFFLWFIAIASLFGDGCLGFARIKNGIEASWRFNITLGGFFALLLAYARVKAANKQADTAIEQTKAAIEQAKAANEQSGISSRSNYAQRYEKASEMLWHSDEAGMREAGCFALKSLSQDDVSMAMQCRELLVSFIQHSSPTPKQKKKKQKELSRSDIVAADQALSSLYQKWCDSEEFTSFRLDVLPPWFWCKDLLGPKLGYPGANLSGTWFSNDTNLSGTDLSKAILSKTSLPTAKLIKANLRGADLRGADLTNADLSGADLTGADLTGANISGADFIGDTIDKRDPEVVYSAEFTAKGLTEEHIRSAYSFSNSRPKVPDELVELADNMDEPPPNFWHDIPKSPTTSSSSSADKK